MNETIKITVLCPKCGLHRENALENHRMGDPTALNLLRSCPECWKWAVGQYQHINNPQASPVDTALAGFYDLLRHYYEPDDAERVITIPEFDSSLRAILEALVEDVESNASLTRKVRP